MKENNKLIAEFDGWTYIVCAKSENDLYEAGDKQGGWETHDIFVLNPSKEFLKQKKFGGFAPKDYYNDEKPYDDWNYSLPYHKDWNLLIGVLKKIREISNTKFTIDEYDKMKSITKYLNPYDYEINFIYGKVVEFIKWYNNEKS